MGEEGETETGPCSGTGQTHHVAAVVGVMSPTSGRLSHSRAFCREQEQEQAGRAMAMRGAGARGGTREGRRTSHSSRPLMVLGKVFRLSVQKEGGKASFLLEHRNDRQQCLLFESGAVTALSAREVDLIRGLFRHQIDGYGCMGVLQLESENGALLHFLVLVTGCVSVGKIQDSEIFRITDTGFISLRGWPQDGDKILEVRRVLNSGTFYFSWTAAADRLPLDISLCAQRRVRTDVTDNRFFWNQTLHLHLQRFGIDCNKWLLKTMCGGVCISTVYVGSTQAKVCIFSRLSNERAGTRFNVRGVNDDGHVANFTETEQVIFSDQDVSSYVLVRGSVPLFWEQPGVNVGSHKIRMSRGSEISQPAFNRHIGLLKQRYGRQHLITLCGSKTGEANLTRLYKAHHRASAIAKDTPLTDFDYHHYCSRGRTENLRKLKDQISKSLNVFGFFTSVSGSVTHKQNGTFRVNCVDCLDRTNSVETFIGLEVLEQQLKSLNLTEKATTVSRFQETFKNMWTLNGDHVSRIYAGTGALEGKSKLKDSTLSVARTIQNNLLDSGKQEAIDFLLAGITLENEYADRMRSLLPRQYVCLQPEVLKCLCDRHLQFTTPNKVKLMIGTWNVNGGKHFNSIVFKRSDPLSDWLCINSGKNSAPNIMDLSHEDSLAGDCDDPAPDIYAIGFEEIVDLNASNIVAASTSNQMEWLVELQKTISRDTPYVLVTSVQLVGVCLFVFVRPRHAQNVKDVAMDQVKTGLGGATGNKGGVAVRFRFYASTMAFVCAHFAAGQHQVSDRNADFTEISKKMVFPMSRTLNSHDYVFWCGDFNYRIDLDNEYVRDLVMRQDWRTLLDSDQLLIQKNEGKVFDGYVEGQIAFPPTYKYDINSDDYDTSEKNRIPAYTDRILFRKNFTTNPSELLANLKLDASIHYQRAELKTSDHRPVRALIEAEVLKVDTARRDEVLREALEEFGPQDGTVVVTDSCGGIDGLSASVVSELLKALAAEAGPVILARFGEQSFNVIFSQGKYALRALPFDGRAFNDVAVNIRLKTPDWTDFMMHQIDSLCDSVIPLHDDEELVQAVEQELAHDVALGPEVDLKLILGADDDDLCGSGRSTPLPLTPCSDEMPNGPKVVPSRPPPPPAASVPQRPAPPVSVSPAADLPKPMRPAPPPPVKAPLMKQEALVAPSITKTAPSTDRESVASQDSRSSVDKEPEPLLDPFEVNPVDIANNGWAAQQTDVPISDRNIPSPLPPVLPPPPLPPAHDVDPGDFSQSAESEFDDSVYVPPPLVAPPPPPVPECGPRVPPPIPSRGGAAPSVPPRPRT